MTASTEMPCQICKRSPALHVTLRRHIGMLLMQKFVKFDGYLCRDHGLEAANSFLRKTLVQGWWGVTSFFFNIAAVLTNLSAKSRLSKLAAPVAPVAAPPNPAAISIVPAK